MLRRILLLTAVAAVVVLLMAGGGIHRSPRATAATPPPCPSAPGPAWPETYHVFATLPIGVPNADGICIQLPGFPPLSAGGVTQAPSLCPSPPIATGAGGSAVAGWVWADWGIPCVAAGQTVVLQFQGPPGLPLGRIPGTAQWDILGSPQLITDSTVWPSQCPTSPAGVGGVPLIATAIAPVGGTYDGVCMTFVAPVPGVHNPIVLLNPPACPPAVAVVGAAVLQVWDDFTVKCANPGDVLQVLFWGPPGLVGPCPGCATWLDGAVAGDVAITSACAVATTDPDGNGDIDFCNPGPTGQPCVQDHGEDMNGDGYSDADELTPTGPPGCAGAFPATGGLGLIGLSSTGIAAPCQGRLLSTMGGNAAQDFGARKAHADVNLNGKVDLADLIIMAGKYNQLVTGPTDMRADLDLNGNGKVDLADLIIAAGLYGLMVPPC
jgi:hypothetical protein